MNPSIYQQVSTFLNIPKRMTIAQDPTTQSLKRLLLLSCGHALTGLGFIGMLLPLLPTTVFWIGAAICYAKSSPDLYHKLIGHKRFGKAIQLYLDHGVISRAGKSLALLGMSFSALLIAFSPLNHLLILAALGTLALAAIYVMNCPAKPLEH